MRPQSGVSFPWKSRSQLHIKRADEIRPHSSLRWFGFDSAQHSSTFYSVYRVLSGMFRFLVDFYRSLPSKGLYSHILHSIWIELKRDFDEMTTIDIITSWTVMKRSMGEDLSLFLKFLTKFNWNRSFSLIGRLGPVGTQLWSDDHLSEFTRQEKKKQRRPFSLI